MAIMDVDSSYLDMSYSSREGYITLKDKVLIICRASPILHVYASVHQ